MTVETKATDLLTDSLKFGQDHPVLKVNIRSTNRDDGIDALAANIEADGILQSLLVWRDVDGDGGDYVLAGSRRLTAVRRIRDKDGSRFELLPTLLRTGGTPQEALAWSLATDIFQVPPHPVDQFEAFHAIWSDRMTKKSDELPDEIVKSIAARYGTTELIVQRRLALGNVAPSIRQAWKDGEIEPGQAMAFTLQPDQDLQAKLFARLKKSHRLNAWEIRREIVGETANTSALLTFVGRERYTAAGGHIIRDLFAEKDGAGDGVSDPALLNKLATERLDTEILSLEGQGWGWVARADAMPAGWHYAWERIEAPKGKKPWKDEDKARSGVVVSIGSNGEFEREHGVLKPTAKAKTGSEKKTSAVHTAGDAEDGFGLSKNMIRSLQRQATAGLASALRMQPDVALAAIVAGMMPGTMSVVRVGSNGIARRLAGMGHSEKAIDFVPTFKHLLKVAGPVRITPLMEGVGSIAASALDLGYDGLNPSPLTRDDAAAIVAALKPVTVNKALRTAFEAEEYFEGVPKSLCLTAIKEALGAETHDRLARGSKADIVKVAIADVAKTGWLPPELRAECYDGPVATKAKPAAAKLKPNKAKAAKKAKARK